MNEEHAKASMPLRLMASPLGRDGLGPPSLRAALTASDQSGEEYPRNVHRETSRGASPGADAVCWRRNARVPDYSRTLTGMADRGMAGVGRREPG
jgi:hypothetical protein